MSTTSPTQPHASTPPENPGDSHRSTVVRRCLKGAALLLTIGGTYLVLNDIFAERLNAFLGEHRSGALGVLAIILALGCAYLLRQQRAPRPRKNKLKGVEREILSKFTDAEIELKLLHDEITFYKSFAAKNVRLYWMFKVPTLLSAAIIPICALLLQKNQWITAILGALIAICEGIMHIGQFHENWLRGVATQEHLTRELYLFAASASVYAESNTPKKSTAILTERVISIMQNEQAQWLEGHRSRAPHDASAKPVAGGNPVPPPATIK